MLRSERSAVTYRPDIDGLRALAVICVVLFHGNVPGFGGGFVGVDVFFVISGYLITKLVDGEIQRGEFTYGEFYERRIRRIFPALAVTLCVCWVIGAKLLMPPDFAALGKSMGAAGLSISNFHFWQESGYFEGESELKPLLHTWSLAIEEQYYILLPPALAFCRKWHLRTRLSLVGAVGSCSFVASVWGVEHSPESAFYLLPFRAWELLLGSSLALGIGLVQLPRVLRELLAGGGLLALALSTYCYTKVTPFPGVAALAPTLGAASLIAANGSGQTFVGQVLSSRALVGVGLISYSVYLLHWPILVFLRHASPGEPSSTALLLAVLGSFVVAWASWRWVERPFRRRLGPSVRAIAVGGGVMLLVAAAGAATAFWDGIPSRLSPEAQRYVAMYDKAQYFGIYDRGHCFLDYDQAAGDYDAKSCSAFPESGKVKVFVIGDSFAAHIVPGLATGTSAESFDVRQYTATSCRPIVTGFQRCDAILKKVPSVLARAKPDIVVVSAHWAPYVARYGAKAFSLRLVKTLKQLRSKNLLVVLVGQTPTFQGVVPYSLASKPSLWQADPAILTAEDHRGVNELLRSIGHRLSIPFFDPYMAGCKGLRCRVASGVEPYYWDHGHMTMAGSTFYGEALSQFLAKSRAQTRSPKAK